MTLTFTVTAANLLADSTADVVFPVRVSVTDPNGAGGNVTVMDEVTITIMPAAGPTDTAPAFAVGETIAAQTYTAGTAIPALTLPAATGGDGALTYTLAPAIPGLTLNPTTRVLSGTPANIAESTHTYTVTDEDGDTATLALDVVVEMGTPADTAPVFAGDASIGNQVYVVGTAIPALTLPAVETRWRRRHHLHADPGHRRPDP